MSIGILYGILGGFYDEFYKGLNGFYRACYKDSIRILKGFSK
jgi:hypothetical protein